jgi:hypothetical protein
MSAYGKTVAQGDMSSNPVRGPSDTPRARALCQFPGEVVRTAETRTHWLTLARARDTTDLSLRQLGGRLRSLPQLGSQGGVSARPGQVRLLTPDRSGHRPGRLPPAARSAVTPTQGLGQEREVVTEPFQRGSAVSRRGRHAGLLGHRRQEIGYRARGFENLWAMLPGGTTIRH